MKHFIPANYGRTGEGFVIDGVTEREAGRAGQRISGLSTGFHSAPVYHSNGSSSGSSGGGGGKPGSSGDGRVIKIINAHDGSLHERVLLNLRTTQPFEDVVADLGQVLKISRANKLYTRRGREIRGFSHLRNDFFNEDTFFVSQGPVKASKLLEYQDDDDDSLGGSGRYSPRSESRLQRFGGSDPSFLTAARRGRNGGGGGPSSRSSSRTGGSADEPAPIKVMVDGVKRYVFPPTSGYYDNTREPTEKLELDWAFGYSGKEADASSRNLWTLASGAVLYSLGPIAVILERGKGSGADTQVLT